MIIGIIGGGQLGMMMAESAHKLGHKVIGLDPNLNCPLSKVADEMVIYEYNDPLGFESIASKCDVITYEFENVDDSLISKYIDKIPQKSRALVLSKDRYKEKEFAKKLHIPTPTYKVYHEQNDLFYPSIIKTRTGGYDGKGQQIIRDHDDVDRIKSIQTREHIIEEFIDYDYEISVVASRSVAGDVEVFPIPVNYHKNGILFTSTVNHDVPKSVSDEAIEYTKRIINELDYVGTFAVEYFVVNDTVIFNEFAPRPHNSGHYTIEGCTVSQFDNHILAITGKKLRKPVLNGPSIMLNIIGIKPLSLMSLYPHTYLHDYYKIEEKPGRKMGHITITGETLKECTIELKRLIEVYYG